MALSAIAQRLNVKGTVSDVNKEAVIGATVLIKGSNVGTKTDLYGQFILQGVKPGSQLVVSYIGMKTKPSTPLSLYRLYWKMTTRYSTR